MTFPSRGFAVCAALALLGACSSSASSHNAAPVVTSTTTQTTTTATSPVTQPSATAAFAQRTEAALPVAIQEAAAATVDNRLYVAGGYDTSRNSSSAVFVFDGATWTDGPSLPIAVNHPGAAAIGDVYVAGGFTPDGATNRAFVLGAGSTSWRALPSMRRARGALALLSIGNRLFAIGGRDGDTQIEIPEVYDPSRDAWTDATPMPASRNHVAGYTDGAFACVAGGRTPATSAAIDCLDTANGAWKPRPSLPVATSGAAAVVLEGVTLVAGGEPSNETSLVNQVQELRGDSWSNQPMLVPRHGTAAAAYRGRFWMCGGATAPGFQAVATCTSLG